MLGSLYCGITGMDAAQAAMNVIGNNIANVKTAAFKAGTISFASVYAENEQGKGVQLAGLGSVWQQGAIESTMNPTDVSISGDGFFKVVENGVSDYYTRAGQFSYDENYNMVDPEGRMVQGFDCDPVTGIATTSSNVDITIPSGYTEVNLETGGFITAENAAGTREYLFQIAVFDFPNVDGLKKMTGNLYQQSGGSGAPLYAYGNVSGVNGAGKVNNNNLEMSNVDLARDFVDLIVSQRSFQANSRVISSSADMLQEVINIIR